MAIGPALLPEVLEGGVHVAQDAVVVEALVLLDDLGEVAVGDGAAACPVEEVGGHGVVALGGQVARHLLDVVVDPEGLLDHDHRPAGVAVGAGLEQVHGPVGRVEGDCPVLHAASSFRAAASRSSASGSHGARRATLTWSAPVST